MQKLSEFEFLALMNKFDFVLLLRTLTLNAYLSLKILPEQELSQF